ncbi:hypothetical protein Gotri_022901 [Gossypium trilobum]|uniref:Uncharacterized protein n=6 Tax=Gossypium TaxID=3633 RepID=A0A7J9INV6_9ROSI|nr:hypothetical protein [Gossypium lobatum]MBA0642527.1 hypothetical protein [Gossypium klotzschianum]MBA0706380.1 hypothetical protein [Gossypium laxum]MBA0760123.1 hypothetical protein [Gossypium trilobum]MBA0793038.1 hypothetical protein [Gossypium harknessii]MBA0823791.1 hypothetical protein [Gossypium armourianum]
MREFLCLIWDLLPAYTIGRVNCSII